MRQWSYDSDVDLAKKIMQEECQNHPLIYDNRSEIDKQEGKPMIRVAVVKFDDSAVVIRVWARALSFSESIAVTRDVFETVKKRFDTEGIEIPFPYPTIVMKYEEESKTEPTTLT